MSISKKTPDQLKELKDTLKSCPHIQEVYFCDNGDHYFSVHEFQEKGKGTGKFYGRLKTENVLYKVVGERKFFKTQSVETPETEITETLNRDEVLNYGEEKKKSKKEVAENAQS